MSIAKSYALMGGECLDVFMEFCVDGPRDELEGVDGVLFAGGKD